MSKARGGVVVPFSRRREAEPTVTPQLLAHCSTAEARKLLDVKLALRYQALPLGVLGSLSDRVVTVAMDRPADGEVLQHLRFALGASIKVIDAPARCINEAISIAYHGDDVRLVEASQKLSSMEIAGPRRDSDSRPPFHLARGEASLFVVALVEYALAHRCSDIHFVPTHSGCVVRIRINGELRTHRDPICSPSHYDAVVRRIKVLSALDITVRTVPQDGSFEVPAQQGRAHIRVSILPTVHGEKVVLRLIGALDRLLLNDLGLPEQVVGWYRQIVSVGEGAILLCGATGSGKSSTLYALAEDMIERDLSVVSLEDPVERVVSGMSQTAVGDTTGITFDLGLRAVLRQDPDVILLGEIRDRETAGIAAQASVTGHIVLSSVHARGVSDVPLRLKHLGLDSLSISQAVNLIICQRLLPALCEECKVFDLRGAQRCGFDVYRAVGCPACDHSGYAGRVLVLEAISIDGEIRQRLAHGDMRLSVEEFPAHAVILKDEISRHLRAGRIGLLYE